MEKEFDVQLVSVTKGAGKLEGKTAQEIIVHNARVSSPQNQTKFETASNLLRYCIKNGHWSVFEQAGMGVEITTTRAISAQILRHRSFQFSEYSGRYAKFAEQIKYKPRRQDTKNRQNSFDDLSSDDLAFFNKAQEDVWNLAYSKYEEALAKGIAKESARSLLPMSTKTKLYMTGSVRSWVHYINLRQENGTQKEHRDIALVIKQIFSEQFPDIAKALGYIPE